MKLNSVIGILLFCLSVCAYAETEMQKSDVKDSSAKVVEENKAAENVAADVPAPTPVPAEKNAVEEPVAEKTLTPKDSALLKVDVAAAEKDSSDSKTDASKAADSTKGGGLLGSLLPVEKDEAIAQGHLLGGATLSLIQAETNDDAFNAIIGEIYSAEGYTFTVEAFAGYFLWDAGALGVRAGYSRSWYDIDFSLLEDLMDLSQHRKYVSNGFFVQPFFKKYMKVFDSKLFYVFNETSLLVEYSYGLMQTDDGEDMSKVRNKMWTFKFGLNPGICIMVLDRFAFETSVGLLGLSSSVIQVDDNGEKHSELSYNVVNFTINLLALDFSLVYFF